MEKIKEKVIRNYWHEVVKACKAMDSVKQLEAYELQLSREYNLSADDVAKFHLQYLMKATSELKRKFYFGNNENFAKMIRYENDLITPKRKETKWNP